MTFGLKKISLDMRLATSISNNFKWLIFFACITLSVSFYWLVYRSYVKEQTEFLPQEAKQVEYILTNSIQNVENYAYFIGQRIAEHNNPDDLNYIAKLLGGYANNSPNPQNLFITSLFDWVDPDQRMVVTSNQGVLSTPIDMSHRDYLSSTPKYPWTLQMQDPAIGIPSNQWIIPGGMGITNSEGKFLGSITLGLAIDGLAKNINSTLGSNKLHFAILTNDFKFVGGTFGGSPTDDKFFFIRALEKNNSNFLYDSGFLDKTIAYGSDVYSYYQRTSKYNYIILTGYDSSLPGELFNKVLLPRLLEFLILGTVIVLLLLLTRKYMVDPLIQLSNVTDQIARDEKITNLPRSNIKEIRNLSQQLIKVKRSMLREKKHKKQIARARAQAEEALTVAYEAKTAKDEFLKKLRYDLKMPLTTILGSAEIMMTEQLGPLSQKYREIAQGIFKISYKIGTLMTNALNCKMINTSEILQQCISTYKDKATSSNINYTASISPDLPAIYVDENRFRHIISGVIYQSLVLTPPEENIHITARTITKDSAPVRLIVTVEDTGFGCNESFRRASVDKLGSGLNRTNDGVDMTINSIRNILALHQGTLDIEAVRDKGTVFTISIPYLDEKDISPTPDIIINYTSTDDPNVTPLFKDRKPV
jgi:signal transduction histidine kinase